MTIDKSAALLVVDDNPNMRSAIKNILADLGSLNVHQAASGEEAQRVMQDKTIAAVFCDWDMPGMSGLQLLQWVRNVSPQGNLPFMMLAGETDREQIRLAMEAGVTECMIKPFTIGAFAGKFQSLFELRKGAPAGPPAAARAARATAPKLIGMAEPLEERIKKSTVLVVDDMAVNIKVIAGILSEDGYGIKVAISGKKALEMVAASRPDIILLDIMMPEMDGFEVCRRLKADPDTADIPIIFLSAMDQAENVVAGLELGAVDYVTKPVDPTILKARMRTHLRLAGTLADLKHQNAIIADNALLREDVERIARYDLKQPLGAILENSERLLDSASLPPTERAAVQTLDAAAYEALGMIGRSIDLYRMEHGFYQPQRETTLLKQVVNSVIGRIGVGTPARSFIVFEAELAVDADRLLCHILLGNLLRHAHTVAQVGGTITIGGARDGSHCVLTIDYDGTIPVARRERFFDMHGEGSEGDFGNYAARMMAEVQGGSVELSAVEGRNRLTLRLQAA